MNIKHYIITLTLAFSIISTPSHADKIYRFLDKEGVSTLSNVLPPYAVKQGYDILDDQSYHLIERVLTLEEASKINAEQRRLAEIKEKAEKAKLARLNNDRSLLNRYPNDSVIIKARDADLAFLKTQIYEVTVHKTYSEQNLNKLQQQAAKQELNGKIVSSELAESLAIAQQDIIKDKRHIDSLEEDYALTKARYAKDLARLRQLID